MTGRPFSVCNGYLERGNMHNVEVVVRSSTLNKSMPNREVLITNSLHHHGMLPVAILVHASERLRAVAPLPVAAF